MIKKVLVICSGGMDSITLAHMISSNPDMELKGLVCFDYGQRHSKEILYAKTCAEKLDVSFTLVPIPNLGELLKSSLTFDGQIPKGSYNQENMTSTVVPNRNAIMLSIAFGIGSSMNVDMIAIAVHGGDHFIYPDCRPEFLKTFDEMQQLALQGLSSPRLYAPYKNMSKSEIAVIAKQLDLDIVETWSCYEGGEIHCGLCGTCVERKQAVNDSGVKDSTAYLN